MQPVTLYLTISVLSLYTTPHPGQRDLVGAGAVRPSMAQDAMKSTRSTVAAGIEMFSPSKNHLPGGFYAPMPPAANQWAGVSPAEDALHDTNEAVTTFNLSKTREGALERIKWVMDTVSPVAEVRCNDLFVNL